MAKVGREVARRLSEEQSTDLKLLELDITESLNKLRERFGLIEGEKAIVVNPERQELYLVEDGKIAKVFKVSTGIKGLGGKEHSGMTPTGAHRVAEKIGEGAKLGSVFSSRELTGEQVSIENLNNGKDPLTLTRLLWLQGLEAGVNAGGEVDTYSRYIYIHGTNQEAKLGEPMSYGCIRMKNTEVAELFDLITVGTLVEIIDKPYADKQDDREGGQVY